MPDLDDVRAYYERILPFYEKESPARAHLAFWTGLARRLRPRRILEIGSGLGPITEALSRHAPTVGIDVSFEMLGRACRRLRSRSRARLVAADMRDRVFACRFDLIVAPSDPFCHLMKERDRRLALARVADSLSPDGRFVLEGLHRRRGFVYPDRRIRFPGGVLRVEEVWSPVDLRRNLWRATYRYRENLAGRVERTLEASFVARAWNPGQVRRLFASCGLAVEELRGDLGRRPFRAAASRSFIVVARRRARFVHRNRNQEEESER